MEGQIASNFRLVSEKVACAAKGRQVRLVAVSKTKPKVFELIRFWQQVCLATLKVILTRSDFLE